MKKCRCEKGNTDKLNRMEAKIEGVSLGKCMYQEKESKVHMSFIFIYNDLWLTLLKIREGKEGLISNILRIGGSSFDYKSLPLEFDDEFTKLLQKY